MINRIADISLRQAALVAGVGYLSVFILGFFGSDFALASIIMEGDASTAANNIRASELLFRKITGIWLFLMAVDVVIAWALYVFFKPVSKNLALLTAWFRLVFVAISAGRFGNLISITQLYNGTNYMTAFDPSQLQAQAILYLNAYDFGMHVSFIFFGLHIFGLGYLILKSDFMPSFLGIVLIIASIGYQINSFGNILSSSYANNEVLFFVFVAIPAVIAEFSLTLWLLIKGGKDEQQDNLAPASS